ncbi:ribonuclease Z [Candidatus Pacearchaeota archaeon]|nr:ribonuclease Z [Candidatus Pacearchaeota archaeon]
MIKVTFLGTSYAIPTPERNHTGILLSYGAENILIDCGEGTQRQFRIAKINPCKLTRILITHWHGDHVLGLPGVLQTLSLTGYSKILHIYGPHGIKKHLENIIRTFTFQLNYKIVVQEVSNKVFETDDFVIEAKPMTHSIICNAYSFIKKGKIRIDKNKLKKIKDISIENLKKLKQGKDITHNRKKYKNKDFTFKEDDKKVSFVLDTSINNKIVGFVKNSDLLVCEATFHSEITSEASKKKHLTAKQAGEITKKSNSKKLIITHISDRYKTNLQRLLDDAKKVFKNTTMAKDFDVVELK